MLYECVDSSLAICAGYPCGSAMDCRSGFEPAADRLDGNRLGWPGSDIRPRRHSDLQTRRIFPSGRQVCDAYPGEFRCGDWLIRAAAIAVACCPIWRRESASVASSPRYFSTSVDKQVLILCAAIISDSSCFSDMAEKSELSRGIAAEILVTSARSSSSAFSQTIKAPDLPSPLAAKVAFREPSASAINCRSVVIDSRASPRSF